MLIFLLLILLIPFQTHPLLSANIMGLSLIKIIGILAIIVAFFYNPPRDENFKSVTSIQQAFFVILFSIVMISSVTTNSDYSSSSLQSYFSFVVFNFITLRLIHTEERLLLTTKCLLITICVSSLYIIKEYIIYSKIYGINFRPFGGTYGDPNYYAQSAIMVLPIIYFYTKTISKTYQRYIVMLMAFFLCLALVFANSRGAFVAIGVMLVLFIYLSEKRIKVALLLLALCFVIGLLLPQRVYDRFERTQVVEEGTATGDVASTTRRLMLAQSALNMIKEHPIMGVGLGNFKPKSIIYQPKLGYPGIAHDAYLELIAELGIPAFLLFIGIIIATFRDLFWIRSITEQSDYRTFLLSTCLIISLTGYCITALFLSGQNKIFWLFVFITMNFKRIVYSKSQLALTQDH